MVMVLVGNGGGHECRWRVWTRYSEHVVLDGEMESFYLEMDSSHREVLSLVSLSFASSLGFASSLPFHCPEQIVLPPTYTISCFIFQSIFHHIIHPPFQLVINSLVPNLTRLFSPPIIRFHPKLSTIHSYHTFRSSVWRKMVTSSSEWSGM